MTSPVLKCEIALNTPPLTPQASSTWTDISSALRGELFIRRGRNHEQQEFEAGSARLRLNNFSRAFDPDNTSSPYYPYIRPMVKIRIGAVWGGTTEWLFVGYVESWRPGYNALMAWCDLECVDGFAYFNLRTISGGRIEEWSGDRISAILDTLVWPSAERVYMTGEVVMVEQIGITSQALAYMQLVARSEGGQLFINRQGYVVFEDRSYRDGLTSVATFSDDPTGVDLPYAEFDVSMDDSLLYNNISVTRDGGIEQLAGDATSGSRYFVRWLHQSGLLMLDDSVANSHAERLLARYKDPRTRVVRFVVDPGVRNVWPNVLDLGLSQVITLERTGLHGGSPLSLQQHVEAVQWDITKERWLLSLQLSPKLSVSPAVGTVNTTDDWIALALSGGWAVSGPPYPDPSFRKDGDGWVTLRGVVTGGSLSPTVMATLPVGYRPAASQRFTITTGTTSGNLLVQAGGNMYLQTGSTSVVDLSAVRFRTH